MTQSRRTVIVVAIVLAGTITIVGSGAFTSTTTERTASIGVAGDDSALLVITEHGSASGDIDFSGGDSFSFSVVQQATTTYEKVFRIGNQGTQNVSIWITETDNTGFQDENNTDLITFYNSTYGGFGSCENQVRSIETKSNAVEVEPGDDLVVSIQINSSDLADPDAEVDLLDEMTVHADATVEAPSGNQAC